VRWSSDPEAAMATAEVVVANGSGGADTKTAFKEIYSKLKQEMLEDPAFEFTDESLQWIDRVMLFSPPLIEFIVGGCRLLDLWRSRQLFRFLLSLLRLAVEFFRREGYE
jgi:hypothetical protein